MQKIKKLQFKAFRGQRPELPPSMRRFHILNWHPHVVPVVTFVVLFVLTVSGLFIAHLLRHQAPPRDNKIVIISHDNQQQIVPTKQATVGSLLQKLNLKLNQGDVVEPSPNTVIAQDQFRINIYRAVPVEIVDGAQRTFTFSAAKTPRSVAAQSGEKVLPDDNVTNSPAQNFLKQGAIGSQVVIDRATPVNVNLYGTALSIRTHADTVGDLIKQKNIHLAKDDQVMPAADTPLTPNSQVFIVRNGVKIESVTEQIAMPVQTISDPSLAYGTNAIRQQGSPGQKVTTYQSTTKNGVVVARAPLQTVVTQQPVTQVVVVGSSLSGIKGDMALAGISPGDYQYVDYIVSHESGWCPTKAQGQYGGCPPYSGSVPSYGGYGLCQSTPGSKMASAGSDWATNPVTQLRWCSGYAKGRYGSWAAAYSHWVSYHNW